MAPKNRKTNSLVSRGKYPEVLSWLNNAESQILPTEHNIHTTKHQWTSEPELWMYQPGCEPKRTLLQSNKYYGSKYNKDNKHYPNSTRSTGGRKSSIASDESTNEDNNYDSSTEYEESDDHSLTNTNSFNNKNVTFPNSSSNKNKTFSLRTSTAYNRKAQRRHRMKYGRKLESSKSDSYHKKYVWDMVLNDRAVWAIREEYRQYRKVQAKARKFSGTNSECSQTSKNLTSSRHISQHSSLKKVGSSNSHVNDLLLRSISQRYARNSKEEIRKISQTGSAIFAHIDANIESNGRHPAKSSSKEDSNKSSTKRRGNHQVSKHQYNVKSNLALQPDQCDLSAVTGQTNHLSIGAETHATPTLSLQNNNNSVGGTNSYYNSSGHMTSNSGGYPAGYPQVSPYLDPMLLQALVMGNLLNPMLNYQLQQQQQQQQAQNQVTNNLAANGGNNMYTPYTSQLPSANGGYPVFQQEMLSQMLAAANGVNSNNGNNTNKLNTTNANANKNPNPNHLNDARNPRNKVELAHSSEESEDIRPSRHAFYDDNNDLHTRHNKSSKNKGNHHTSRHQSEAKFERTKTYYEQPDDNDKFRAGSVSVIGGGDHNQNKKNSLRQKVSHRGSTNLEHATDARPTILNKESPTLYTHNNNTPIPTSVIPTSTQDNSVSHYLNKLKTCVETLKSSGWYWNKLSGEAAMRTVENKGLGAFLIRDSTHQKYLFTLTVHTTNGPTNVRILFKHGHFGLDCDGSAKDNAGIRFNCVVAMIAHYVNNSKKYKRIEHRRQKEQKGHNDDISKVNTNDSIALLLLAPCRKQAPTLQHLARIAVNKKLSKRSARNSGLKLEDLIKDKEVIEYCRKYPYSV